MTSERLTGRLVQSYSYTVPADPGWAQPNRHRGEGTEPNERDDAPAGGGWQPNAWGESGVNVLKGNDSPSLERGHKGTGHKGSEGRGAANVSKIVRLDNRDELRAPGDAPGLLLGAGGANNGGLRAEGSAPWMNPGASRRRADGKTVFRVPGFLLGHRHTPVTAQHRQALHMNKPTIRGVRQKQIVVGSGPLVRPVGPITPKSHPQVGPYTYDEAPQTPANAGPIGAGWAL
jgi:hypothetical protein